VNIEGRERFFRAIAERIDVDRVEEVHVFPAIRQGGGESGVAVVTLRPEAPESEAAEQAELADAQHDAGVESVADVESVDDVENVDDVDRVDDVENVDDVESVEDVESVDDVENIGGVEGIDGADLVDIVDDLLNDSAETVEAPPPVPPRRFTVLRAHYRLQLKGPDRGKWEVGVVEEADAPAATVDEVVRGVHERAGGWSVEGPEHLTGDEFRAALVEEPWSATR
jgi:hypothetical protein